MSGASVLRNSPGAGRGPGEWGERPGEHMPAQRWQRFSAPARAAARDQGAVFPDLLILLENLEVCIVGGFPGLNVDNQLKIKKKKPCVTNKSHLWPRLGPSDGSLHPLAGTLNCGDIFSHSFTHSLIH